MPGPRVYVAAPPFDGLFGGKGVPLRGGQRAGRPTSSHERGFVGEGFIPPAGRRGRRPLQAEPAGVLVIVTAAAAWGHAALRIP